MASLGNDTCSTLICTSTSLNHHLYISSLLKQCACRTNPGKSCSDQQYLHGLAFSATLKVIGYFCCSILRATSVVDCSTRNVGRLAVARQDAGNGFAQIF